MYWHKEKETGSLYPSLSLVDHDGTIMYSSNTPQDSPPISRGESADDLPDHITMGVDLGADDDKTSFIEEDFGPPVTEETLSDVYEELIVAMGLNEEYDADKWFDVRPMSTYSYDEDGQLSSVSSAFTDDGCDMSDDNIMDILITNFTDTVESINPPMWAVIDALEFLTDYFSNYTPQDYDNESYSENEEESDLYDGDDDYDLEEESGDIETYFSQGDMEIISVNGTIYRGTKL